MPHRTPGFGILALFAISAVGLVGCPIRTEHKVETTHKIEAHIVIDVRKVQEQAGEIENEVRGSETPKAEPDPGSRTGAMMARPDEPYFLAAPPRTIWSIFDVSTRAAAAENPEAAAISRRKARANQINGELNRGCLGENNLGYVEPRPCDAVSSSSDKAALRTLADDENRDRKTVYGAIAVREGLRAEQADAIGEIFAGEIRKRLTSGQPFQAPLAGDLYEDFLRTDLANKLGRPRPGTWVQVP